MRAALLLLAFVPLATGLNLVTRRGVLASSFAFSIQVPAFAETEVFEKAQDAADIIREEGVLKSTGKRVPPALVGAIVLGAAAAGGAYAFDFQGGNDYQLGEKPLPTGIAQADDDKYEASRWTNEVDLPWMTKPAAAAETEIQDADEPTGE